MELVVVAIESAEDDSRVLVKFEGGLTRLFMRENFLETVKKESFYEQNKGIIHLACMCI